jgi:hypothetical protein
MTVPTEVEFTEWLHEADGYHNYTKETLDLIETAEVTQEALARFFRAAVAEEVNARTRLDSTAVGKWIAQQREFRRAGTIVFRGRRNAASLLFIDKNPPDNWAEEEAIDCFSRSMREGSSGTGVPIPSSLPAQRLDRALSVWRRGFSFRSDWKTSAIRAVSEYHYTNAHSVSLRASRHWSSLHRNAVDALDEFLEQMRELRDHDLCPVRFPSTLESTLSMLIKWPNEPEFPVTRSGKLARERLFVYRLWRANMRAARKSKPEAIAELMGMEGFGHQYDTRHVERICRRFSGNFGVVSLQN